MRISLHNIAHIPPTGGEIIRHVRVGIKVVQFLNRFRMEVTILNCVQFALLVETAPNLHGRHLLGVAVY